MLRGLHAKLMMIMVLLILSLMAVVGAFLINSVLSFYLNEFYGQMAEVFNDNTQLYHDLHNEVEGETDGAQQICDVLWLYSGDLGVNRSRGDRSFYILDGMTGNFLAGSDEEGGKTLNYSSVNLLNALQSNEIAVYGEGNVAAQSMDLAIRISRGDNWYIIYILDNKATVNSLTEEILILVMQALLFGLLISILLSFLLSKTMVTPLQGLTESARRVARGDFSQKLPAISSKDEIAVLTDTFNDMAGQLQDTIRQVENERNKLGTLFLHMTDGVVAFSWEGTLIHSNPAAEKMLQRKLGAESRYEELFGEMVTLDDVLQEPDYLARDVQVGSRDLNMLLAPFDRQRQGGVLVVVHDVTEQRRNEAMHREFVANVSHELRTPLTNIRSYAETLVEDADNIAPAIEKKFLNVILSESDRMTNIVQDLLTLSRFDSGYADLALTRFSFGKSVNDLYQAVYMEAQRHNHTLKLELEPNLPGIVADKDRIFQVMMNVVSNAIKYTPDGGCITLRAGQRAGWVWFEVDDNGIGIPMQDREHIFDRFYRVDKARSRQSGGTGLGLSIAKEIVNRHEGVLTLRDKEEPGLAIRLELKLEGPNDG